MNRASLQSPQPHLIAAMVTPFTRTGKVDGPSLERLVHALHQGGIEEYFVLGSTGESPLLDEPDRLTVIETVRAAAPNGLLYAGISGTGHRHAIRNAHAAARAGADSVVLMSPFFLSLDQAQLVAYCTAVADASPLPVMLYHHLRMPTPITASAVEQLARHENILGLKDTSGGDHDRCAEILAVAAGHPFRFLQGVEKLVLRSLQAGAHGCVVAQACLAPQLFRGLFDAWAARDLPRATELQRQIDALWAIFSRPEVKQSFSHFLHTLKLPLLDRGILTSTAGALPPVFFEPEFERMIREFMQHHLETPALRPA